MHMHIHTANHTHHILVCVCPTCMHLHIHTAKHTHHIIIGICLSPLYSFIMEKVDLVIVGAEGVAESGGVINKVNTRIPSVHFVRYLIQ